MVKPIAIAITIACTACTEATTAARSPAPERQYFCCEKVELQWWSGQDCKPVDPKEAADCTEMLVCSGDWGRSDGSGPLNPPGITTQCRVPE